MCMAENCRRAYLERADGHWEGICMGWVLPLALAIVQLLIIVRLLLNREISTDARLAWLLLALFLPALGAVLYLLFGEPWLARRFRGRVAVTRHSLALPQSPAAIGRSSIPDRYRSAFQTCAAIAGGEVVGGNRVALAEDSDGAIAFMIADFDRAVDTIHVSFYIWLTDHNGSKVAEALQRAARRGMTCRVVVDGVGSRDLIASPLWAAMATAGVRLCVSLKPEIGFSLASISRPDLRNHRKIVVVDGTITYCGSQNCADPQFRIKPKFAPWVDVMLRLEGPVAQQNQLIFARDWMVEYGEDLSGLLHAPTSAETGSGVEAVAFGTGPTSPRGAMSSAFVTLLNCAERHVVISTPYFVPDSPLIAALLSCARRGVETTLVVPARNDSVVVSAISHAYYGELLAAGVRVHEFHGGLLHAKTLVVDGQVTLIGSANMDYRSLYLNFENNILLYSEATSATVRRRQDEWLASSTAVEQAAVQSRPALRVAFDNLLTMVGPLF